MSLPKHLYIPLLKLAIALEIVKKGGSQNGKRIYADAHAGNKKNILQARL